MTNPTPLSPAAFAVVDAFVCANARKTDPSSNADIAAALRAAALHLYSQEEETCGGASYALMIDVDDLLAIADELEAQ